MENLLAAFDFENFLPGQEEVVREILHGTNKNFIVHMQPGGGKTAAYQLAGSASGSGTVMAICLDLKVFIHQQVSFLNGKNLRAETINHKVVAPERYELSDELRDGGSNIRFFYVTPEMIGYKGRVAELIEELCMRQEFSFVVVENSLVIEGFRENLAHLRQLRKINPNLKWIIMTSDANEIDEIRQEFGIMDAKVYSDSA